MRQVSDAFLLVIVEAASALAGLFLIGVFFYVETGFRRSTAAPAVFAPYMRASTRIVLVLFAMAIGLSLALVALEPVWARLLLLVLSAVLVAANVDSAARIRAVTAATRSWVLVVTEVLGTVAVAGIVLLPWALGGLRPDREDMTWAVLLSFGTGLLSVFAVVMSVFDVADPDDPAGPAGSADPAASVGPADPADPEEP